MRLFSLALGVSALGCATADPAPEETGAVPPRSDGSARGPAGKLVRASGQAIAGQYIVVLDAGVARLATEPALAGARPRSAAAAVAAELTQRHGGELTATFEHVIDGFAVTTDAAGLAGLLADPRVAYVEEDSVAVPAALQTGATWGIDRIDQRALPLDSTYYYANPSPAPHVYIIDTGVRGSHVEFAGRMGLGVSFINDGHGTDDCKGHGTHVAGTVAGTTWGIAKNAIVHPVRIANCGGAGSESAVLSALSWVVANRQGFAVVNMSYGFPNGNATVDAAAAAVVAAGIPMVVAAGNEGVGTCESSPGRVPAVITVGSTDQTDTRAADSNFGSCVDVFAPGVNITSAGIASNTAQDSNSGTSMAAPHVAGAIARYFADKPGVTPADIACVAFGGPGCAPGTGAATPDKIKNLDAGTRNALLYLPGLAPVITGLQCPVSGSSGGNTYVCQVSYASDAPATVRWPSGAGGASYTGRCATGTRVTVTVTVTNPYGAVSRSSSSFLCPSGPIP